MSRDPGLDSLLDLNGECFRMDNGYWTKIEAWRVTPTPQIPHGIRYCLTLHDRYNKRVFGYDNAHAPPSRSRGKYKGRIVEFDHSHQSAADTGTPYAFVSAQQLVDDFFNAVNRIVYGE